MNELNARQEKFVAEYLKTLNVTQSAVKAGYSPHTAHVQGSRLLKNEKVAHYINEQRDKIIDDSILSARELLLLLSNAAIGDETEIREVTVKRGEFQENPDTERMNLVYNEHVELVEVPIKASDRLRARDMLGKYHSLFTENVNMNVATPVFIDSIGYDDDKNKEDLEKLSKEYPNAMFHIDDIE